MILPEPRNCLARASDSSTRAGVRAAPSGMCSGRPSGNAPRSNWSRPNASTVPRRRLTSHERSTVAPYASIFRPTSARVAAVIDCGIPSFLWWTIAECSTSAITEATVAASNAWDWSEKSWVAPEGSAATIAARRDSTALSRSIGKCGTRSSERLPVSPCVGNPSSERLLLTGAVSAQGVVGASRLRRLRLLGRA